MPTLWIEGELETLLSLIRLLDQQLTKLSDKSVESEDADAYGYFDSMEHLVGLAMVTGQTYAATVCGAVSVEKKSALSRGPIHSSGKTKVEIINHAANYWKHNNEWGAERSNRRRQAIEEAFASVGFPVGTDYPLSGVLTELSNPKLASLDALVGILREWKSAVLK
ncbi:hypothetical protein [Polaromonas sp.]|uniref:hypothetical protein n=1 Tax=Polaromonas sp. TaxID=1869339 RepID=UPI003C973C4D